jgi:AAA15 family ATPase/GTPase
MSFLTEIEIKNFKCFDDFKADGFKRVNLIGGKNNVGKTAFMEVCYVNLNGDEQYYLNAVFKVIRQRENFFAANNLANIFDFFKTSFFYYSTLSKQYKKNLIHIINSNIEKTEFVFEKKITNIIITYTLNGKNDITNISTSSFKKMLLDEYFETNIKINFIRPIGICDEGIIEHYSYLQMLNKEDFLNEKLKIFDDNMIGFKIINNIPEINVKSNGYISLSQFGDGVKHLVNIIISLFCF